jgi:hypothetical protein
MRTIARRRRSARSASKPSCQTRLAMQVPFFPRMSLMESPDPAMIPSLPPGHQLISCPSSEESRHSDLFLSLAAAMANAHQSGQRVLAWRNRLRMSSGTCRHHRSARRAVHHSPHRAGSHCYCCPDPANDGAPWLMPCARSEAVHGSTSGDHRIA